MKNSIAKKMLSILLVAVMLMTTQSIVGLAASNPDELPEGYVDNSNEGMLELMEEYVAQSATQQGAISLMTANSNTIFV